MATELLNAPGVHYKEAGGTCHAALIIDEDPEVEFRVTVEVHRPGLLNALITERHNDVDHDASAEEHWHYGTEDNPPESAV